MRRSCTPAFSQVRQPRPLAPLPRRPDRWTRMEHFRHPSRGWWNTAPAPLAATQMAAWEATRMAAGGTGHHRQAPPAAGPVLSPVWARSEEMGRGAADGRAGRGESLPRSESSRTANPPLPPPLPRARPPSMARIGGGRDQARGGERSPPSSQEPGRSILGWRSTSDGGSGWRPKASSRWKHGSAPHPPPPSPTS